MRLWFLRNLLFQSHVASSFNFQVLFFFKKSLETFEKAVKRPTESSSVSLSHGKKYGYLSVGGNEFVGVMQICKIAGINIIYFNSFLFIFMLDRLFTFKQLKLLLLL